MLLCRRRACACMMVTGKKFLPGPEPIQCDALVMVLGGCDAPLTTTERARTAGSCRAGGARCSYTCCAVRSANDQAQARRQGRSAQSRYRHWFIPSM